MKMTSFKTLIFCAFILLVYVSKGNGLQCWSCNSQAEGEGACDHARKSETFTADMLNRPICVSAKFAFKNDSSKTYFFRSIFQASKSIQFPADDCVNEAFVREVYGERAKYINLQQCQTCYEDFCNVAVRGQTCILVMIAGIIISLSFYM